MSGWAPLCGQNLVLNPSFETYSACPLGPSEFANSVNWSEPFVNAVTDTCSTSDLYNACNLLGCLGTSVPCNILGNEPARTGSGYAGIITYEAFSFIGCLALFGSGWREYVQAEFSSPLVAGQAYCVSFYISLADNVKFATQDFGVYFSPTRVSINCTTVGSSSALQPLGYNPQLTWTGSWATNESGWTKYQASYIAAGGERYMIIGNFKDDANTQYVCIDSAAFNPYAYYYIDDVEVVASNLCCPNITIINISSQGNVTCFGASDGTATVSATGGIAPYIYSWSTGATGATISNQAAGSYRVTATDASGCTALETIVITQPTQLTVSILPSTTSCGVSATASPSGGTGPFSYSWSNGSTTASITNLATGTYTVSVRDNNNCTATASANITQSGGLTLNLTSTQPSCSACDGEMTVTPVGGTPPYSYTWSSGETSSSISSLCTGTYTVTVTDNGGSTGTSVFWSENFSSGGTGWTLNINGPGTNDANANQWVINNSGGCAACPGNGSGGNYLHVTCGSGLPCVGSAGDCTYDTGVPIFSNASTDKYVASPNISTIGKTGITLTFWYMCDGENGADYGLVRLSNNGGSSWTDLPTQYSATPGCTQATISIPALYENIADFRIGFRWVNNNNFNGNDPPFMIDDIELSATNNNAACTATATFNLSSANSPVVTLDSKTDVKCFGDADGAINVSVTGGTPPYDFLWTGGATTQNISGLSGGMYEVTVTDSVNCTGSLSVLIGEPSSALTVTGLTTDAGCGTPDGSINITASGGTSPYVFSWSNGLLTEDLVNINAGDYQVTVTDSNLCEAIDSFTVNAPGSFTLALTADSAECAGSDDGSITMTVSGGSSPFQYSWSTGATTSNISDLSAGVYVVTVTDGNNCSVTDSATVDAPDVLNTIASITKVQCEGGNDGGIKLIPSGGTPYPTSPAYIVTWSNGASGLTLTALPPGIYVATIKDAHGCELDTSFNLSSFSSYQLETFVTNASCDGSASGSVNVSIVNGTTPPYSYLWSTGDSAAIVVNLIPGEYRVTVTDSLGCLRLDTAVVGAGNGFEISDSVANASCRGIADGAIFITVTGGTPPYSYLWNNGVTASSNINIRAGEYFLTVTDADNCIDTDSVIVALDSSRLDECVEIVIYDVFSPNGDGVNDLWMVDGLEDYAENELEIYNRWGSRIYHANPYENEWDGRSENGEFLPAATYYYILKLNDADKTIYSGTVTLIR